MCDTCGCGEQAGARATGPLTAGARHGHPHPRPHDGPARTVVIEESLLAQNDELAARNRAWLAGRAVVAVNLRSCPSAPPAATASRRGTAGCAAWARRGAERRASAGPACRTV